MIVLVLCVVGILTSSIVALRCTHVRKQTIVKPDVVYSEICREVNVMATQDIDTAHSEEVAHRSPCEDEYITMMQTSLP